MSKILTTLGLPSNNLNKVNSIKNLETVRGKYVGSGFYVTVADFSGKVIAKFEIRGEEFDDAIDPLTKGIKESLKISKALLDHELKEIESVLI